ncbi:energy transducer TonB [Chromobacterium amazonense]|uniref:Energy transducer TonB n=2 Tax=Chromobacterium TaxID=535 RepID=A0ABU8V7M8_9NEIS|nr:energy transducer TonB [Chromobacterium amazonense]MDQ4540115.1 energy transducer TonB [Chromobacterium amazonense]
MTDHLHRSRPFAPNNRPLWLMAGVSLLAHAALLSLFGAAPSAPPPAASGPLQISLRPRHLPAPAAPVTERVAEDNRQGAGNTAAPRQLISRSDTPKPAASPAPPPQQQTAPLTPITRATPNAAQLASTPPSATVSTGSLLAQVGALSRSGDNAAADNDQESGQPGDNLGEAARGYSWARYQADWRLKVERIGNLNYPDEARRLGLHGAVTLEVTIAADGSLHGMRVSRSSGTPVLDQAAQRIVELASPFAPFPSSLAARNPTLRISQKFVFTRDNLLSSH